MSEYQKPHSALVPPTSPFVHHFFIFIRHSSYDSLWFLWSDLGEVYCAFIAALLSTTKSDIDQESLTKDSCTLTQINSLICSDAASTVLLLSLSFEISHSCTMVKATHKIVLQQGFVVSVSCRTSCVANIVPLLLNQIKQKTQLNCIFTEKLRYLQLFPLSSSAI